MVEMYPCSPERPELHVVGVRDPQKHHARNNLTFEFFTNLGCPSFSVKFHHCFWASPLCQKKKLKLVEVKAKRSGWKGQHTIWVKVWTRRHSRSGNDSVLLQAHKSYGCSLDVFEGMIVRFWDIWWSGLSADGASKASALYRNTVEFLKSSLKKIFFCNISE